jgi:RNA polymerase sigma-70 factor (ECF subfamily)
MLDAELVDAARKGDVACLGVALDSHRAALFGLAMLMLHDRMRAEDAVQETYVVAMRELASLRDPAALGSWLRVTVKNVCRMEIRRRHEIPLETVPCAGVDDVDAALERVAVADWLWTALTRLPEDIRATMMMRHFSRRASYAEISTVLGIPIGTVRSRLSQGRRYLTEALDATATSEHADNARLVRRRWEEYAEALRIMHGEGRAAPYFADCSTNVLVSAPAMGYATRGTLGEQRNIESGLAVGVRMHLARVLACDGVTIVEAGYENPPHAPEHCPPWHTEIRLQENARTTRLVLHFGSRTSSRR